MSENGPRASARGRRVVAAIGVLSSLAATAGAALARPAGAQPVPVPVGARLANATPDSTAVAAPSLAPFGATVRQPSAADRRRAPLWAAAASAVVPGAGQALLRQPHGIVYAALEAYMWLSAREARRFSNAQAAEYRDIARTIARRDAPGAKPDGDWDYYERLEKLCGSTLQFNTRCLSSGVYDRVPGGDVDPELDINTYNGQIWAQARRTYGPGGAEPAPGSAAYRLAIAEYAERAEKPEFYWSWVNQQQQQDVYRQAIQTSNDKWHEYLRDKNVIIANHVLSMVDAFVTVRVRRYGRPGVARERRTGLEASVPWAPFGRPRDPR